MVALVATACGSSSSPSPGITKTSILIGATVPLTGPAAPGYSQIAPATNAVFKWANAHGGVDGRMIDYDYLDDGYDPSVTVTQTRQLVSLDKIFAEVGSVGTSTQGAVQSFLEQQKVPQVFVASGCVCWNDPTDPESFGWQPNYEVEGKILGNYLKDNFGTEKVGYLYQDDAFGLGLVSGLDQELPGSQVVSRQPYDAAALSGALSGPLHDQVAALKAARAKVVVLATIPAATALTLLAAAAIGYAPQWVCSSDGVDPSTVGALLSSYSKGKAGDGLLNGMISDAYLPPESDTANPWIPVTEKLLHDYDEDAQLNGNTEYGVALGYTFLQALQAAGPNLTRASLLNAITTDGSSFVTPGLVPLTYSPSDHYGYSGAQVVQIENGRFLTLSPVYTATNTGPVRVYTGTPSGPPASLSSTA